MIYLLGYVMPFAMLLWIPAMAQESSQGDPVAEHVLMAVYFAVLFPVACVVWRHTWKHPDARRPKRPLTENQVWWVWMTGLVLWAFVAPVLAIILGLGVSQVSETFVYVVCMGVGGVGMLLFVFGEAWIYRNRHLFNSRDLC